jgi:hypothetical protein
MIWGEEECIRVIGRKVRKKTMPLGRPRREWEDNSKMDLGKI